MTDTSSVASICADPAHVGKSETGWTRVKVGELWESEFWPILQKDDLLRDLHENCINDWLEDNPGLRRSKSKWKYSEDCESPFFFTSTDGACMWVDARVDEAAEAGDPAAFAHSALTTILCGEHEFAFSKSVENALWRELEKVEQQFHPERQTHVEWWRPGHSCHWIAPFALCLAKSWRPDQEWKILRGDMHSTVVCIGTKEIFDILLWDDEKTDLIEFATRPAPEQNAA